MADINRADVEVNFKDVYGNTITDEVEIKIYNTQLQSLKNIYNVSFKGQPVTLVGVPAFPTGHAQMIITPNKYRFKQRFINVETGITNRVTEYFFVEPSKAKPHPIEFGDLGNKTYGANLLQILHDSEIGEDEWNKLSKQNRATILNLCAKMSRETVKSGAKLTSFIQRIDQTWLDSQHRERIYALVKPGLLAALRAYPEKYFSVDSSMHKFPSDEWASVDPPDSFKTLKDAAGNIQLTFASKVETVGNLADIDLDDHKGLQHVADVLKHKFSGKDTDPYDIHEILWFFQQLDAEYRLL